MGVRTKMIGMLSKAASAWAAIQRWFRRAPSATRLAEDRSTLARWLDLGEMPGWRPDVAPEADAALVSAAPTRSTGTEVAPLRWPVLSLALVAVAAWLWFALGAAPASLVFDRHAISAGEWWRLATGHWVHSDAAHAAVNIAALALIAPIVESAGRRLLLAALVAGSGVVSAGIVWGVPELVRYCGLSGVLNTLFVAALAVVWQRNRSPVVLVFGGALLCKLAFELASGTSLVVTTEWPSVPAAHLAGVLGGPVLMSVLGLFRVAARKLAPAQGTKIGKSLPRSPTKAPRRRPAVANDGVGVLTCP